MSAHSWVTLNLPPEEGRVSTSRTIFPQNILATDLAWPLATSYSDGLIQFIHLAEKHPSQADGFCQVGNSTSSRKGQASSSTSTKEREELCSCGERDSSPNCGRLADQLNHLVQFHWQEQVLVVLAKRSKKITMQNWHLYHSFKMEFITHLQMKFYFPLTNTNTLVSSWSLGILTLKRREKPSCGGEQTDSQLVIWFLFQKTPPHSIL